MKLPLLAFGNSRSALTSGVEASTEAFRQIVPSASLGSAVPGMVTRTVVSRLGNTRVAAHCSTAGSITVDDAQGWHLLVPIAGAASSRVDGVTLKFGAHMGGALMPNMRRETDTGTRSLFVAAISPERLRYIGAGMAGVDPSRLQLGERPHFLPFDRQQGLFGSFLELCRLIDRTEQDQRLAAGLGVEDMLYRWLGISMGWLDAEHAMTPTSPSRRSLDDLCDMIRQSFSRPLTMSEMEQISGLSSRAIQYAFQARFGCSPMEWQRCERMTMAQQELIARGPEGNITQLAYAMAFSSSAAFTTLYKRHFGETPTETKERVFRLPPA